MPALAYYPLALATDPAPTTSVGFSLLPYSPNLSSPLDVYAPPKDLGEYRQVAQL